VESAIDMLVELGAIDLERSSDGAIAAVMPDVVDPQRVAVELGTADFVVREAVGRDDDSVWVLRPRPISVGRVRILPDAFDREPGAIRLIDSAAFGTGLHPTTMLCLEWLDDLLSLEHHAEVLDVGTGSGVLALAALTLGASRAVAIDIDDHTLTVAAENIRLNDADLRVQLLRAGPGDIDGTWPLVLANVLAAPLIEMAPTLVRRVAHHGRLVLSGIPESVEPDVEHAYRRLGMRGADVKRRRGWSALMLQAGW
jgi:ribosomal protein L11 methyltransferase